MIKVEDCEGSLLETANSDFFHCLKPLVDAEFGMWFG